MDRDQILISLRERILAFATLRVSRAQAEDLAQEVLVVLHEKYPNVAGLTELVPLAFQVLRFKMLDAHRKSLRRGEYHQESVEDIPLADPGDDPAAQVVSIRHVRCPFYEAVPMHHACTWSLRRRRRDGSRQLAPRRPDGGCDNIASVRITGR